ncbi:TPA: hypothetical protein ACJMKJ_001096 [Bacillus wiedmannii]
MKFKKTNTENGIKTMEWNFNIPVFILAIAKLIQVLHEAGII